MLVVFGGVAVDGRGSIGGDTFSRNKSRAYVRARVTPVNPNSQRQSDIRAIMSTVASKWLDSANPVQRLEWETFALNMEETNKVGQTIRHSGFNQFVKSNTVALNAGLPQILNGPAVFALPAQDASVTITVSESTQLISVNFADGRDWLDLDGAGMIVQMGLPQNATINFFDGPWRHAGVIAGDSGTPPTTPTMIAVPFPVVELQKIFVKTKIILDDGRVSDWFQVNIICDS